jgi:two-component system, OmpR family, KDP operon response regulator KdpE
MSENLPRILIVDDERAIRRFLSVSLGSQYKIFEAANGEEALQCATMAHPDLIILDLGLPDMDGAEVTRRLREWTKIPIIIISVRDREDDKIAALDAGADDYLTKPFGIGELMARIRVAQRRSSQPENSPVFHLDDLNIDMARRIVSVRGEPVTLTPTEYDILRTLVQNSGRVLTHRQLLKQVWGESYENETHLLRVNMSNLRRKIEQDASRPHYILTEPGVGYRLKDMP